MEATRKVHVLQRRARNVDRQAQAGRRHEPFHGEFHHPVVEQRNEADAFSDRQEMQWGEDLAGIQAQAKRDLGNDFVAHIEAEIAVVAGQAVDPDQEQAKGRAAAHGIGKLAGQMFGELNPVERPGQGIAARQER